mmetsp:Transcript_12794/g.51339  ORF Transcript_12794/g.51339 Transcript_12794/m.51339 type:complete len:98 (-) Transcript_12794:95-388(-)
MHPRPRAGTRYTNILQDLDLQHGRSAVLSEDMLLFASSDFHSSDSALNSLNMSCQACGAISRILWREDPFQLQLCFVFLPICQSNGAEIPAFFKSIY